MAANVDDWPNVLGEGEVLHELPYVAVVTGDHWLGAVCFSCLRQAPTMMCSGCNQAWYCNSPCQKAGNISLSVIRHFTDIPIYKIPLSVQIGIRSSISTNVNCSATVHTWRN